MDPIFLGFLDIVGGRRCSKLAWILSRSERGRRARSSCFNSHRLPPGPTMDPSFLLAFPLLLALSTPCSACICKILHPQTFYCMSDIGELTETLEKCPPRRRSCPGEQKHRGGGALVIRTVFKETAWGTLKSMTHFFLLSVVVADIIGQGRGTFLKRNYKIRVTEVSPTPLPFSPPSLKTNKLSNQLLLRGLDVF